jgi:signal transduction histidine kinase
LAQDPISIIIRAINHDAGDLISPVLDCIHILFSVYGRTTGQQPNQRQLEILESIRIAEQKCDELRLGIEQAIRGYQNAESQENLASSINARIVTKSYELHKLCSNLEDYWRECRDIMVAADLVEGVDLPANGISHYSNNLRGFFEKIDSIQNEIINSMNHETDTMSEFNLALTDIANKYPNVLYKVEGTFGSRFSVNRGLIYLYFREIISNAFKYRKVSCDVHLSISEYLESASVCVEIRDAGQGMPDDDCVDKIWQPLTRLSNAVQKDGNSAIPGQGNGLNIVKLIAEHIGASVSAESSVGHGAILRLHLPLSLLKPDD